MPIDIVFIVGDSNSGKSTQVRCLTGKGNDAHSHTDQKNILDLVWIHGTFPSEKLVIEKTLVMNSSLNEGSKASNHGLVHPQGLRQFLNDYDSKDCTKAILCISSSENMNGWRELDYKNQIQNGLIGKHTVTHCVELGVNGSAIASTAINVQQFPVSPVSRNQIAEQVRRFIKLV